MDGFPYNDYILPPSNALITIPFMGQYPYNYSVSKPSMSEKRFRGAVLVSHLSSLTDRFRGRVLRGSSHLYIYIVWICMYSIYSVYIIIYIYCFNIYIHPLVHPGKVPVG